MFRCSALTLTLLAVSGGLGILGVCACSTGGGVDPAASLPPSASGASTSSIAAEEAPSVHIVFRGGRVFAREGDREWPIAEVGRDEMLWAPGGRRFAYVKLRSTTPASRPAAPEDGAGPPAAAVSEGDAPAESTDAKHDGVAQKPDGAAHGRGKRARRGKPEPEQFVIVIRNLRGDSVNEFPVYRPGRPSEMDWVDNERLGYLAPPDKSGEVYVVHAVASSEILKIFRGRGFIWSPGRKQLAYVSGKREHVVKVNDEIVWPRASEPARRRRGRRDRRRIMSDLVWSPEGGGLAFMEQQGKLGKLVVLLVVDNRDGDLSWPLPSGALAPDNRLFWGKSKVVIGASMLKPRFAASWKRLH